MNETHDDPAQETDKSEEIEQLRRQIEQLQRDLRIAEHQLARSERTRRTREDFHESDAAMRDSVIAERDRYQSERNEIQARLYTAQEEERQRLSAELHDQCGQHITAARQFIWLAEQEAQSLGDDPRAQRIRRHTEQVAANINSLNNITHGLLTELWPDVLGQAGLHAAVDDLLAQWGEANPCVELEVTLQVIPQFQRAILVYRILQEWLTNVSRHSQATWLDLSLSHYEVGGNAPNRATLCIADNGVGFVVRDQQGKGRGLSTMRERAQTLGAAFEIRSEPGDGAHLELDFPLT